MKVVNRYGCGCVLETTRNPRDYTFTMCTKHKAASDMYEALKNVLFDLENEGEVMMPTVDEINKALNKAEGGKQ